MPAATPESLFDARLRRDPGAPVVTFYDDATGERAELSAKSLGNWVAKTYALLADSLGLGPGDTALVRLPVHWLAVPVLFGCWYAGLEVVATGPATVAFADAGSLPDLGARPADEVFAVSMLSMARPDTPPDGTEDYTSAVRPMPDAWAGVQPRGTAADPALAGRSRAELVTLAERRAAELGLERGGRLLWSDPWTGPEDLVPAVLAPLAVGGSTVLVRNPDPAALDRRAAAERVTTRH
ncbi:MAG TPA: TIGR03089 family protein [Jatrophihabitans sp.]|nr:TIGR03089 family protein [Jatrophihabitans sp.]